jgi:hypothetical protein
MRTITDIEDRHAVIDRRDGEYLCFPDVIRADDGRLIAAYNESDRHVTPSRRVLLVKTSFDNGRTWSDFRRMDAKHSHCPRLTRLAGGEILLSASGHRFYRSRDNGDSWEAHSATGLTHDMFDRILTLDDQWLTTGHCHRGTAAHPAIRQAPAEQMVFRSEDRGRTWHPVSIIGRERNLVLCEASMTALPDGRIAALMRENSFVLEPMYLCFSEDQGETWSDPVPTPLIGHRPTMGRTSSGDLLVTYRDVSPDHGTRAWLGSLEELVSGFRVHGRSEPWNPVLTEDGLRVANPETNDNLVRYALRPMTDPRSARVVLEAELRVDRAGQNGCGLRLETWWKITPEAIVPDAKDAVPVPLEPGKFHTVRLEFSDGEVTLSVDGEKRSRIAANPDQADARAILFGAPYPFEDNAVDCTWKRVALTMDEPRMGRRYDWQWDWRQGMPDAWVADNVLELRNDRMAAPPDFGYSGWTELEPGEFYCAFHHGGGREEGYDPMFTSHVRGVRFSREDFKIPRI